MPEVSRAEANDIDWATVIVSVRLPVPAALVAPRDTGKEPGVELVPEIRPEDVFRLMPAGSPDAEKDVGEFVAVIW